MFNMFATLTLVFDCIRLLVPVGFKVPKTGLNLTGLVVILILCGVKVGRTLALSIAEVVLSNFVFKGLFNVLCDLSKKLLDFLIVILLGGSSEFDITKIDVNKNATRGVKRLLITVIIMRACRIKCCLPILLITKRIAKLLVKLITGRILGEVRKVSLMWLL